MLRNHAYSGPPTCSNLLRGIAVAASFVLILRRAVFAHAGQARRGRDGMDSGSSVRPAVTVAGERVADPVLLYAGRCGHGSSTLRTVPGTDAPILGRPRRADQALPRYQEPAEPSSARTVRTVKEDGLKAPTSSQVHHGLCCAVVVRWRRGARHTMESARGCLRNRKIT